MLSPLFIIRLSQRIVIVNNFLKFLEKNFLN
nr:MAG TPA: hypothetical protein [Caudoviricetes sp.]